MGMKIHAFLITGFVFIACATFAQDNNEYFWIRFVDKQGTEYSVNQPEAFLSERAIERRNKQGIEIDETDLPVSKIYLDSLQKIGFSIVHTSKWMNGCTVKSDNKDLIEVLSSISFISSHQLSKPANSPKSAKNKFQDELLTKLPDTLSYGAARFQIQQINGKPLHDNGFRGEGIHIAVLDGGFKNVNSVSAFDSLWINKRILGMRDFVNPEGDIFSFDDHGTKVLSTMGANISAVMVGTAPGASYYLFRAEDDNSEYIIEEDNWIAAAEYADSLGVDIINTSLGYSEFDDSATDHSYSDMDGNTTRVTRAANMAVEKGMLVFNSAGNSGSKSWKYITAPSDGDHVISVGAITNAGARASFSSFGPAADGDVKPNVVALGYNTTVFLDSDIVEQASGTSFASPIIAGMSACLWQANPEATSFEVKQAIEKSANQYANPDDALGYGIPDFAYADLLLKIENLPEEEIKSNWFIFPNPCNNFLRMKWLPEEKFEECKVQLFNLSGAKLFEQHFKQNDQIVLNNLADLPDGLLILKIECGESVSERKIVKTGN